MDFGIRIEQHKIVVGMHRRTTIAAYDEAFVLFVGQQCNERLIRQPLQILVDLRFWRAVIDNNNVALLDIVMRQHGAQASPHLCFVCINGDHNIDH